MRYVFTDQLSTSKYHVLLAFLLKKCQHFSVCTFKVHKKFTSESYKSFFSQFEAYRQNPYDFLLPQHYERGQKFFVYELNPETRRFINEKKDFFEWKLPDLPEDIAFYYHRRVVFSVISHERMIIVDSFDSELMGKIGGINIEIRPLDL